MLRLELRNISKQYPAVKANDGVRLRVRDLEAINGTENFYKRPELVLDVGLRGALVDGPLR